MCHSPTAVVWSPSTCRWRLVEVVRPFISCDCARVTGNPEVIPRTSWKVRFSVTCPDFAVCRHSSKAPCSKDPQLILRQICDVIMAVVPGLPNRCAPTMDQRISGWTCSRSQNMPHRNSTPLFRKERPDPLPTDFRQLHMKPLHLSAGKVFLDVQIKSDQCEDDGDWFCSFICMLSCIGVNNVLV